MALTTVNSGGIKDDSIVNADIKSDAAIAKSKLASLDIVNADINASAAIAKSKLASLSITNADIDANAAIAFSKLASLPAQLTGSTNNQITTVTGANTIQGEAKLTFDGSTLGQSITSNGEGILLTAAGNHYTSIKGDADRTGAGNTLLNLQAAWDGTEVASIAMGSGDDTTNKDDGILRFFTATSGSSSSERLRIDSSGRLLVGKTSGTRKVDIDATDSGVRITKAAATNHCAFQLDRDNSDTVGGYLGLAGANGHYADTAVQHDVIVRSQSNLLFTTNGSTEKLRLTGDGNLLLGTSSVPTSYIGANTLAVIDDSDVNAAVIEVGGTNNGNNYNAGSIQFINNANSNSTTAWNANSKIVHIIRAQIATSDNNAGDDSGADLVFYRKPEAGSGTEGFRIKSSGDVTISDGNLIIGTGGHGIDFSAQTASSSGTTGNETLDHYEEGTWTPDFQIGGSSNAAGTNHAGTYTRIGKLLFISAIYYKASGSNTTSGYWQLHGLPFAIEDGTAGGYQSCLAGYTNINSTNYATGSNKNVRWQANGSGYLSMYSDFNNVTWTSGVCEFQVTGVLKIHD